jgi:hypothetical protein
MKVTEVERWGVDIGNVLLWNVPENLRIALETDEMSVEDMVEHLEEVPGAMQGLQFLIDRVGAERVWIISKASALQEAVSRLALKSKFPLATNLGFDLSHLRFCLEKIDKAPILQELGIQGHIDDRGEVIASIQSFVPCPLWLHPEDWDYELWRDRVTHRAVLVQTWQQILEMFT